MGTNMRTKGTFMRKRLLAFAALLALVCALAPGAAFAAQDAPANVDGVVAIEIDGNGIPSASSGDGWSYSEDASTLTLEAGHSFELAGNAYAGKTVNNGTIVGGTFNNSVENRGVIENGVFEDGIDNYGTIAGGVFADNTRTKPYCYTASNYGTIESGTFSVDVNNYDGGTISGGTFNADELGHGYSKNVNNKGAINGGMFAVNVDNRGTIEGNGMFNAPVQNGDPRSSADENKSCVILGSTFNASIESFGTIKGGAFNSDVLSRGVIAGGTFSSTSSVTSNDDGTITGGAFAGSVVNGDPDEPGAVITGGTFSGKVENYDAIKGGAFSAPVTNYGTISSGSFAAPVANKAGGAVKGGQFDGGIVNDGGSVDACQYPLVAKLTGLSLAAAGQEPSENLLVTFQKESGESNLFTLSAGKGYALPSAIELRLGAANGTLLAAGTDYTYDAKTGALAIKKSSAVGPLYLTANGVTDPAPPTPEPQTPDKPNPAPLPVPDNCGAKTLAATGDTALPFAAAGIALLAGSVLIVCGIVRRKARTNR